MLLYYKPKESIDAYIGIGNQKSSEVGFFIKPFNEESHLIFPKTFEKRPHKIEVGKPFPALKSKGHTPGKAKWMHNVEKAKKSFNARFQKVVLARKTTLTFEANLDPREVFKHLSSFDADLYYIELDGAAFLGASPEKLYVRHGLRFYSEAVAGTKTLKEDLLNDPKELHEHQIVKEMIYQTLQEKAENITIAPLDTVQRKNIHHLYTKIEGFTDPSKDLELIEALHPTPATLGHPKQKALQFLKQNEPFSRGFYAGTIGIMGKDFSKVSVMLRCCEIKENTLTLYAAAGIVPSSDPEKEWEELGLKIQPYLDMLCPQSLSL